MLEPVPKALEFVVYVRYIQIQALIHITLTLTINSDINSYTLKEEQRPSFIYHTMFLVRWYSLIRGGSVISYSL